MAFFKRRLGGAKPKPQGAAPKANGATMPPLLTEALGEFELPSFPAAVMQTLQLLRDPNATNAAIARSIESNPALVVRALRMVNSAAFGLRRRVESVSHAVSLLGLGKLETLVVALAVKGQLPSRSSGQFQSKRFWTAAARRASAARALAEVIHPQTQSEAFVGGLLQDMAVPLLAVARPDTYGPLLEAWHHDAATQLVHLERSEFGWDHGKIGGSMADFWELPSRLMTSIDAHHLEGDGADGATVAEPAIRLVAHIRETDEMPGTDAVIEACRDEFGLSPDVVSLRLTAAFEEANELAAMLR